MSEYAVSELRRTTPEPLWPELEQKVERIYPHHAPDPRRSPYRAPAAKEPLRLVFVGGDFFRKGGEAALRTIESVGAQLNLQLTVISRVEGGDYKGTPPADIDVRSVRERLQRNERIRWIQKMPHADVLSLIEDHHVGLLPTLSDTFGYSVLEFMGLGVPSIVTNVQALPEFTGNDTGWQVRIPVDQNGEWLGRDPDLRVRRDRYHEAMDTLTTQLCSALATIRDKPEELIRVSSSTLTRCKEQFSPLGRADDMARVYAEMVVA